MNRKKWKTIEKDSVVSLYKHLLHIDSKIPDWEIQINILSKDQIYHIFNKFHSYLNDISSLNQLDFSNIGNYFVNFHAFLCFCQIWTFTAFCIINIFLQTSVKNCCFWWGWVLITFFKVIIILPLEKPNKLEIRSFFFLELNENLL